MNGRIQPPYTDRYDQIAQLFKNLGLKGNEARVFVVFLKDVDLSSREIERKSDLPQPEVSLAITALLKRQWITVSRLNTENKGRPIKIYNLSVSVNEIFNQIGAEIQNQINNLERIRLTVREFRESE
jgi:predicted transcriptional regulator